MGVQGDIITMRGIRKWEDPVLQLILPIKAKIASTTRQGG